MKSKTGNSYPSDVDTLLKALGPFGMYQKVQLTVYSCCMLSSLFQLFAIVFVGQDNPHICKPVNGTLVGLTSSQTLSEYEDIINYATSNGSMLQWPLTLEFENVSFVYKKCEITVRKTSHNITTESEEECIGGYLYKNWKDSSVVSEFELVCSKAPLLGLTQTLFTLGQGIGSLVFPPMADRWGRKRILLATHALILASGIGLAFSPNYLSFAILKVFAGASQMGVRLTTIIAVIELFPTRLRARISAVISGMGSAAVVAIMSPLAYAVRSQSWRVLQLVFTSTSLLLFVQILILDEPIRWLLANSKTDDARRIIRKALRMNRKTVSAADQHLSAFLQVSTVPVARETVKMTEESSLSIVDDVSDGDCKNKDNEIHDEREFFEDLRVLPQTASKKLSLLDVLKHPRMRLNITISCFLMFINIMTYIALYLTSSSLAGDKYVNFFLNAIVEFPSCFLYFFILDKYGRKLTLIMFHMVCGLSLIAAGVCHSISAENSAMAVLSTVLSLLGKFGVTGSLNVMLIFIAELFPTNCRNLGLGATSAAGRVGGMLAPFAGLLADHVIWAPGVVFGSCGIISMFLVTILPETKGRELPQTIADLDKWYQK